MKTKIYALRDETRYLRYIGKTIKPIESRLAAHIYGARKGEDSHKANGIRLMLNNGFLPSITLIQEAEGDGCKEEMAWIRYLRSKGVVLWNETDGGEGVTMTKEIRAKISAFHKGRKHTPEQIAKQSVSLKGFKHTLETRARMREAKIGIPVTWGAKISAGKMGHPVSKKQIAKWKATRIARDNFRHTKETKEKLRLASIGRFVSQETRIKIGLANKGRKFSAEQRSHMGCKAKMKKVTF